MTMRVVKKEGHKDPITDDCVKDWVADKIRNGRNRWGDRDDSIEKRIERTIDSIGKLVELLAEKRIISTDDIKQIANRYYGDVEIYEEES